MFSRNTHKNLCTKIVPSDALALPPCFRAVRSVEQEGEALLRRRLLGICNFVTPIRLLLLVRLRVELRGFGKFAPRTRLITKVI